MNRRTMDKIRNVLMSEGLDLDTHHYHGTSKATYAWINLERGEELDFEESMYLFLFSDISDHVYEQWYCPWYGPYNQKYSDFRMIEGINSWSRPGICHGSQFDFNGHSGHGDITQGYQRYLRWMLAATTAWQQRMRRYYNRIR